MSNVAKLRARIDAGDAARVYLDFYGSHWVEIKSSGLIPWKSQVRLSPQEAFELRNSIALRNAVVPPRVVAARSSYKRYRGGWITFLPLWIANELRDLLALPYCLTGLPIWASASSILSQRLDRIDERRGSPSPARPRGYDPRRAIR